MRNLERRIKKLEKLTAVQLDNWEAICDEVLFHLGTEVLVDLAGSFGAEKRGEPLTEAQHMLGEPMSHPLNGIAERLGLTVR